jgi:hypothetical protein
MNENTQFVNVWIHKIRLASSLSVPRLRPSSVTIRENKTIVYDNRIIRIVMRISFVVKFWLGRIFPLIYVVSIYLKTLV